MKKRRNAFTLIELLAVIVVLAIIALIATPIVMKTIKNARLKAAERSADNYIKAIETVIMEEKLNGNQIEDGKYEINKDNITNGNKTLTVKVSGNKPSSGVIVIKNGSVTKGSSMTIGDYNVSYKDDKITSWEPYKGVLCKAVTELSTQYVYKQGNIKTGVLASEAGPYAYGVEYTCELGDNDAKTFYVLEENGDNVSLIMNMNIDSEGKGTTSGNAVAWSSDGSNANGPITANNYLKTSTTSWTRLNELQISMPSAEQIAMASGTTFNQESISVSSWLYENLNSDTVPVGYWTSTFYTTGVRYAWYVRSGDYLSSSNVDKVEFGLRPVITISKTNLA